VRAGEDEQDAFAEKFAQGEIAASVQSRQAELGRRCAGFQTVAFDFASAQGTVAVLNQRFRVGR
jgi:hypothetical protein